MALNKLCWREVKHDLLTLPTESSGRIGNKTQESCSLRISLVLLVAFAGVIVDVLLQPHCGEVRKKSICYVQSLCPEQGIRASCIPWAVFLPW